MKDLEDIFLSSGASKTQSSEQALASSQAQLGQQYAGLASQSLGQMNALYQPAIQADTSLVGAAQKGDYSQLIQAAGPQLGILASQNQQASQLTTNSMPAGAGRDSALAQLPQQQASAVAGTLNNSYAQALQQLTQLGSSYGSTGLQEAGAGLAGLTSAGSTYNSVAQSQAQGKASTMSFLGSLAGAGGAAFAGR